MPRKADAEALEILHDVQASGTDYPDVYRSLMSMALTHHWSIDLVDTYVDRMLESGTWCPEALGLAYRYYFRHAPDEQPGEYRAKVGGFLQSVLDRSRERYQGALYAAVVQSFRTTPTASAFRSFNVKWDVLKQGLEDLERRHPNSDYNKQCFCRLACISGDRATAARLFKELGFWDYRDREGIWEDRNEVWTRRGWASDDYQIGMQSKHFDYSVSSVRMARFGHGEGEIFFCDVEGAVGFIKPTSMAVTPRVDRHIPQSMPGAVASTLGGERTAVGLCCGCILYIDGEDYKKEALYTERHSPVRALGFSKDKRWLAAGDRSNAVTLFDLNDAKRPSRLLFENLADEPRFLHFLDDDKTLLCLTADGVVRLWNVADASEVRSWKAAEPPNCFATTSRDGTLLAVTCSKLPTRVFSIADRSRRRISPPDSDRRRVRIHTRQREPRRRRRIRHPAVRRPKLHRDL